MNHHVLSDVFILLNLAWLIIDELLRTSHRCVLLLVDMPVVLKGVLVSQLCVYLDVCHRLLLLRLLV